MTRGIQSSRTLCGPKRQPGTPTVVKTSLFGSDRNYFSDNLRGFVISRLSTERCLLYYLTLTQFIIAINKRYPKLAHVFSSVSVGIEFGAAGQAGVRMSWKEMLLETSHVFLTLLTDFHSFYIKFLVVIR